MIDDAKKLAWYCKDHAWVDYGRFFRRRQESPDRIIVVGVHGKPGDGIPPDFLDLRPMGPRDKICQLCSWVPLHQPERGEACGGNGQEGDLHLIGSGWGRLSSYVNVEIEL